MNYFSRNPSPEKMRRGIKIIETLADQIYYYDEGFSSTRCGMFESYPNWRTDVRDYNAMIRAARRILKSGIRYKVQAAGWGGIENSQFITAGTLERPRELNYRATLERIADIIYERMKKQAPSEEEARRITEEFRRQPHEDYAHDLDDLGFRLGMMDREGVLRRLTAKFMDYYRRKSEAINP